MDTNRLQIVHQQLDGIDIFRLSGNLSRGHAEFARNQFIPLLEESKSALKILLNLRCVSFIDASGIAVLIELYKAAKQRDAKLVLSELQPKPWQLMKIAALTKIFSFFKTESQAIAYYQHTF